MKINPILVLTLLFVILKITNVVNWSWWVVFSPLWISVLIIVLVLAIAAFGVALTAKHYDD